jgi:hypothetical protein
MSSATMVARMGSMSSAPMRMALPVSAAKLRAGIPNPRLWRSATLSRLATSTKPTSRVSIAMRLATR